MSRTTRRSSRMQTAEVSDRIDDLSLQIDEAEERVTNADQPPTERLLHALKGHLNQLDDAVDTPSTESTLSAAKLPRQRRRALTERLSLLHERVDREIARLTGVHPLNSLSRGGSRHPRGRARSPSPTVPPRRTGALFDLCTGWHTTNTNALWVLIFCGALQLLFSSCLVLSFFQNKGASAAGEAS